MALSWLLQSWQSKFDKSGYIEIILINLSKAYDGLPHDLLVTKLEGYGVDQEVLSFILYCLTNRRQRANFVEKTNICDFSDNHTMLWSYIARHIRKRY